MTASDVLLKVQVSKHLICEGFTIETTANGENVAAKC